MSEEEVKEHEGSEGEEEEEEEENPLPEHWKLAEDRKYEMIREMIRKEPELMKSIHPRVPHKTLIVWAVLETLRKLKVVDTILLAFAENPEAALGMPDKKMEFFKKSMEAEADIEALMQEFGTIPEGAEEETANVIPEHELKYILKYGLYEGARNESWKKDGPGRSLFKNGDYFVGVYKDGVREGRGLYRYAATKTYYFGEFSDGKKNGLGFLRYPDGGKYEGGFENDVRHGHGKYTYPNGDVYVGTFSQGQRHGKGKYEFNGMNTVIDGEWEEDTFVRGKQLLGSGGTFEGEVGKEGVFLTPGGLQLQGSFDEMGRFEITQMVESS